jgi:uncharacterized cupredoxin-like copper-binding protein
MKRLRTYAIAPAVALLVVGGIGCSSNNDNGGGGGSSPATSSGGTTTAGAVGATEKDFSIALDPTTASAGDVTFDVHNDGPSTHEFVVFKTKLAPDALPTNDDGTVDEEGKGVEHIDEIEDIAAGSDASLDVNLDAGSYVVICNLPGHYQQGMHTEFTVN